VQSESVDAKMRGLAALALGLLDASSSVPILLQQARSATTPREVAASCVLALGLHASRALQVAQELLAMLRDPQLDREVKAQIPIAMQRLPAQAARPLLTQLVKMLQNPKNSNELRRSLAISLGNLATVEDTEVISALQRALKEDRDIMVHHFACIALGRISEQQEPLATSEALAAYKEIAGQLLRELRFPRERGAQAFAGLAIGLFLRGPDVAEMQWSKRQKIGDLLLQKLRETFDQAADPSTRGALAIGLGLAGDAQAPPLLRRALRSTKNPPLQGHLALGLGLLGDRSALEELRPLVHRKGMTQEYRLDVVRALALLRDRESPEMLVQLLTEARDLPGAAAAAKGLGLVGDRQAAAPLLELVQRPREQDVRRAFGVVALGLLAEKTPVPWNYVYAVDGNYTIVHRPLEEVLSIL
jgi:hypothetical protein